MSGPHNDNWHSANGGLPFRPPTVDEALPYSPFTSIVPFSPDLIPFPSAGPLTPPSTLTSDQQSAATKAVEILNEEANKGPPSTSQQLQQTLQALQNLLDPDTLPQFVFKPVTQLATSSQESNSNAQSNGSAPAKPPLSSFASMLLKNTEVAWVHHSENSPRPASDRTPSEKPPSQPAPRVVIQPQRTTPVHPAHARTSNHHYQTGTPSPATGTPILRPGRAVVVKPLPPGVRPEEYRRFDAPEPETDFPKKKERVENGTTVMKSREREIADRKIAELYLLLEQVQEGRDTEHPGLFTTFDTDHGVLMVLRPTTLSQLSDAVSKVVNLGCFVSVPSKKVLALQSLCEPLITAMNQVTLDLEFGNGDDMVGHLARADIGLKACKLVLQTMTEGCDDRRICSEDRIQGIIRLLKRVLTSCILPVVESRRSSSGLFPLASQHKDEIYRILRLCGSILSQLTTLIGKVKLGGMTLSPIESASIEIIFAQNGEKESESVLGIQKFESFRQKAMDVLAQIFACHSDQRDSIRNDILTNLERLPDKRASARHFKSAREPAMMLVSALFMRLVQAAASNNAEKKSTFPTDVADSEEEDDSDVTDSGTETRKPKQVKRRQAQSQSQSSLATQLWSGARTTVSQIVSTLVVRAENVSKSGDKPFRNLLDLFIEDMCNVLGSPEWPAAALFLESLARIMIPFIQNTKEKGVQAADMALSAFGSMGCGLIDFTNRLRQVKRSLDIGQSDLASKLVPLADDALKRNINIKDVLGINGPYRVVLESLPSYLNRQGAHGNRDDPHLRSLSGFYATAWANAFYKEFHDAEQDESRQQYIVDLQKHVNNVIVDPKWFSRECNFQDVTESESRLAAGIITSQEAFCKFSQSLISFLLQSTKNPSAKVKSRAMASLSQMIEKDPQILDDKTFPLLARLTEDTSPMVRETTVSLIIKCLEQDPSLERHCLQRILNLMTDPANGPKKKAIKLLKDIYAATTEKEKKVRIATELLLPVVDDEKAIAELARSTFEDIWIAPLRSTSRVDENQLRLNRENRVSLLLLTVQSIQNRSAHLQAFEAFFSTILSSTSKNASENFTICKEIVADMVEGVIGTESPTEEKSQAWILQSLSIFAKVNPKLFTTAQVQLLKLYVKNLATTEDLLVFRPTVIIFRHVFPALPTLQETFLEEVRDSLSKVTGKLATQAAQGNMEYKQTLLDIAHCLWIISPLVKGDSGRTTSGMEKLIKMICAVIVQLEPLSYVSKDSPQLPQIEKRILSYMVILGTFGKVCDFDEYIDLFKETLATLVGQSVRTKKATEDQLKRIKAWKSPSVAVLLLHLVLPFTKQTWNINLREQALCTIGEVCQQKTKHFVRADVEKAFKLPFMNKDTRLTRVVLTQFRDFLQNAERRSETGAEIAVGEGAVHGAERLENSFAVSDNDHATTHIARVFLEEIINTALGKSTDLSLPATEILVSVSRQGLLHPKECGAALVALSTSQTPQISLIAAAEHKKIHLQHETMFEKEYVAAVTLAFKYQRDVFGDSRGALDATFKPKLQLLFEAFKQGSRKTLKKFITNLIGELDFELPKLDATGTIPEPILFARFCLENCAFFDYAKLDEVIHVIVTLENMILKQTGPSVALAIETEMPEQQLEQQVLEPSEGSVLEPMPQDGNQTSMPEERLRQLTTASIILHMMWETRTFLRRAYNLQGKIVAKDVIKPALRMNFVTGKDLWERFTSLVAALDAPASMKKECTDFAEIINVDREHAVGEEDVDARDQLARAAAGYETPDEDDDHKAPVPTSGKGRKRKSSAALGNTPKKRRGRLSGTQKIKRNSRTPDDSD